MIPKEYATGLVILLVFTLGISWLIRDIIMFGVMTWALLTYHEFLLLRFIYK